MTLKELIDSTAGGTHLHIGTAHGCGWLFSASCLDLVYREDCDDLDKYLDREITNLYYHEGRKETPGFCRGMKPGIAVLIQGDENGGI